MKTTCAAFLILAAAFVAPTAATADDRADCVASGAPQAAIAACARLLAQPLQPGERAGAFYNRGNAWREAGDFNRAIADYDQTLKLLPNFERAWNNRGLSWLDLGEADRAIADFDRAIAIRDDYAEAWSNRGLAKRRKSLLDEAVADFDRAVELNPRFGDAFFARGVIRGEMGDYDGAIADYNKTIEIDPRSAEALNNRGDAYLKKGAYGQALADLNRAVDLTPGLTEAYYTRGDVLRAMGRYAEAKADLQRAMRLDTAGLHHAYGAGLIAEIDQITGGGGGAPPVVAGGGGGPKPPVVIVDERRVALVIGNSSYSAVTQLPNPANDAEAVAESLRAAGFDVVTVVRDAGRDGFVDALKAFADEADQADWAFVYFAGHGIEVGGTNYLIPVDAELASDRDLPDEAISLDRVLSAVGGAKRMRIVALDACRNNPFASRMKVTSATRSVGRGLARVEPAQATLVAFAARDGSIAQDGDAGNSPFAASLARRLTEPGVEINKLFRLVRNDVLEATSNQQEPFVYGSLPPEDFFFIPPQ